MKEVITVTRGGIVKKTELEDYRLQKRGGKGIIGAKMLEDDEIIEILVVDQEEEIIVASAKGIFIRVNLQDIRTSRRNTTGVRIIVLSDNDEIISAALA